MALQRSPNQSSLVPQIKMIVSDWYTDELGNQTRVIKARSGQEGGPVTGVIWCDVGNPPAVFSHTALKFDRQGYLRPGVDAPRHSSPPGFVFRPAQNVAAVGAVSLHW